jgi:hypothetical protein
VAAPLKGKDSIEGKSTSQGKFTQMEVTYAYVPKNRPG